MNNIVKIAVTALFLMVQVISTTGCADLKEGDGHSPILLLSTNEHFGTYTGQILLAEGFNEYEVDSIGGANVDETFLQQALARFRDMRQDLQQAQERVEE